LCNSFTDDIAAVLDAIGDGRPSVVFTRFDKIDFITAARAHLTEPEFTCNRMDIQALRITVSVAVYLRQRSFGTDKRVARNRFTFCGDVYYFTVTGIELLGVGTGGEIRPFTGSGEDMSVFIKQQTAAEMHAVIVVGDGAVDDLKILYFCFIIGEFSFAHCCEGALRSPFGKSKIEHPAATEIGCRCHIQQSTLTPVVYFRKSCNGSTYVAVGGGDTHSTALFCDGQPAVRQWCDRPWLH